MPKLNPKCSPLAWDYLLAESKSYREQCPTAECYLLNYLVHVCFVGYALRLKSPTTIRSFPRRFLEGQFANLLGIWFRCWKVGRGHQK